MTKPSFKLLLKLNLFLKELLLFSDFTSFTICQRKFHAKTQNVGDPFIISFILAGDEIGSDLGCNHEFVSIYPIPKSELDPDPTWNLLVFRSSINLKNRIRIWIGIQNKKWSALK